MANRSPKHVAIIMDGNGRWAKAQRLPRIAGYQAGIESVRTVVKACIQKKEIEILSLFAFSRENWRRPPEDVSNLMQLFMMALRREIGKLKKQNIQIRFIGDRSRLSKKLQEMIIVAEDVTAANTGLHLVVAMDYSGQWDITEACKHLAMEVNQGKLKIEAITEEHLKPYLAFADLTYPDLLIRTSGEQRVSNFMLWQLAYTELYFTDVWWPDFTTAEFEKALDFFSNRERRFGCTSEQLQQAVSS